MLLPEVTLLYGDPKGKLRFGSPDGKFESTGQMVRFCLKSTRRKETCGNGAGALAERVEGAAKGDLLAVAIALHDAGKFARTFVADRKRPGVTYPIYVGHEEQLFGARRDGDGGRAVPAGRKRRQDHSAAGGRGLRRRTQRNGNAGREAGRRRGPGRSDPGRRPADVRPATTGSAWVGAHAPAPTAHR